MPSLLNDAEVDDGDWAEAASGPSSTRLGLAAVAGRAQLTPMAMDFLTAGSGGTAPLLDADTANRDFGVPGYLKFEGPVYEPTAAAKQHAAQRRAFQEDVLARSELDPLSKIGAGLAGGLFDPVGLPLAFAPEALGARGGLEAALGLRGASAAAKAGRLANAGRYAVVGAAEGALGGIAYESVDYGLRRAVGEDDYTLGDSLQNVVFGTVLGAGLGGVLGAVFGDARPHAVRGQSEESRLGAAAMAIEDVTAGRPVNVAPLIEREAAPPPAAERLRSLDDDASRTPIRARELEADVAVTTRGQEIPVKYAVVELDDLTTSHDDDLSRNPAFPAELQPRDRTRAGSQAANHRLEADLNPKRLMRERGAESGAPLVAPDGTVESGNGRTIALRRSARTGSEAYGRYREELAAQGIDTEGFEKPVLVRIRNAPMDGETRAALTREMNAAPVEAMGPAEQAMSDAASIEPAMLAALDGTPAGERSFVRAFIAKVAPDQQNSFADAEGRLSQQGLGRVRAALVAAAYDDPRLIEAVFETADPNIRTLGQALSDAASGWAAMRAAAARGEIPPALDITAQLRAAVDLVRHARDNRIPVDEWVAQRLDQAELFGGNAVEPETEAFLRMFFRDGTFKRHRSADKIAWALKDYARQASETAPGPNLFGDTPDGEARLILDALAQRFAREDAFPAEGDLLGLGPERAEPPRLDLRADAGGGPGEGLQPGGGEGASGGVAEPAPDAAALIDPELKALAEQDLADAPPTKPKDDPAVIAEAIRAAAFCLREG